MWIGFGVEHYPFGLLTMIVSLEAIFLSTFVMISQNRADEKRNMLADNQWQIVQQEEDQNEQLIGLSTQILDLTKAIHRMTSRIADGSTRRHGRLADGVESRGDALRQLGQLCLVDHQGGGDLQGARHQGSREDAHVPAGTDHPCGQGRVLGHGLR